MLLRRRFIGNGQTLVRFLPSSLEKMGEMGEEEAEEEIIEDSLGTGSLE